MKLDGVSIYELLEGERVTMTAAVPTIWLMLLAHMEANNLKLSTLRRVLIGGSACPRAMIEKFEKNYGVTVAHAWGMTEMNPIGIDLRDQAGLRRERLREDPRREGEAGRGAVHGRDEDRRRRRQGAAVGRQDLRPPEGEGRGGREVLFQGRGRRILDEDGFFDTGDVATIDPYGNMQITDRSKDVIKSGGEWISSIDLENLAVGHPKVMEAAVIGVRHPKWDERPLLIIVLKKGESPTREEMLGFMEGKIAKWWMPDDVVFVERDPAYRDRQDPENRAARPVQGLHAADRGGAPNSARNRRRWEPVCEQEQAEWTHSTTSSSAPGTAGCMLANRLSADAGVSVCVLEAGPRDWHPYIHIPAGFIKLFHQPGLNWLYTQEPSEWTGGRRILAPRGKTLGGSSSINGHIYNRGQRLDYDGWAQRGNRGWGYADVLPYFKRLERRIGEGDDTFRGRDGGLTVTDIDQHHPLCEAFIAGAMSLGIPRNPDYNGESQLGINYAQRAIHKGRRVSAARAFLHPAMTRQNLDGAHATRTRPA